MPAQFDPVGFGDLWSRVYSQATNEIMNPSSPMDTYNQIVGGSSGGSGSGYRLGVELPYGGVSGGSTGGGSGLGASWAEQLKALLGEKPATITPTDATKGVADSTGGILKTLLSGNKELTNQIGQTAGTTTLGGASDALTAYWKRIAGDTAASTLGAGAVGMDSLLGMIPGLVTGQAVGYQNQQQNYLANLLGMQGNLSTAALSSATNLWNTGMNNATSSANNYNALIAQAFSGGASTGTNLLASLYGVGRNVSLPTGGGATPMYSANDDYGSGSLTPGRNASGDQAWKNDTGSLYENAWGDGIDWDWANSYNSNGGSGGVDYGVLAPVGY